jgi:16S rRNA (guanine966-N2)-methyltransferase
MRVISGAARGRRLKVPKGKTVRPTAARVKESLFNILPHDFSGLRVLDLFAGSGNVSIEALSRGAAKAVLIDESPRSAAVIRDNLSKLDLSGRAEVWTAPVLRSLRKLAKLGETFDLVFLDPPYDREWVGMSLKQISQCNLLKQTGNLVAEHSVREAVKTRYGQLVLNDQRRYGDTLLSFFKKDETVNSAD